MTPEQFQAAREVLDLSVPKYARAIGITERTAYRWLAGNAPITPTAERLIALLLRDRRQGGKA